MIDFDEREPQTVRYVDLDWSEPEAVGSQDQLFQSSVAVQLVGAPDLALLDEESSETASSRLRQSSEGLLRGLCSLPGGTSIELRYVRDPDADRPLELYLSVRAQAHDATEAATAATATLASVLASIPRVYAWQNVALRETRPAFADALSICEIRKLELVADAAPDVDNAEYYYAPFPFGGDASQWGHLLDQLADLDGRAIVSLCFSPARLTPAELDAVNEVTRGLEFNALRHEIIDLYGNRVPAAPDASAQKVLRPWQLYRDSLHSGVLARFSVLADPDLLQIVAKSVATAVSTRRDHDHEAETSWPPLTEFPQDDTDLAWALHAFDQRCIAPWGGHELWRQGQGPTAIARIPYAFSTAQAAGAFVLPVPDRQGCRGFPLARRSNARRTTLTSADLPGGDAIDLGRFLSEGDSSQRMVLPLRAVNRHVLIVGAPGSGKTTTVLTMLADLWRRHRVPFLAIEPVKNEYRALALMPGMEACWVFTPGKEAISPIRLNPLEPPPGVSRLEHQGAVLAALQAALPLMPPLPQLLEQSLSNAYRAFGWREDDESDGQRKAPTLRDLLRSFEKLAEKLEYKGEARNVIEALRVRLNSLMVGSKGRMLNTSGSTDWSSLMARPVILELNAIADPDEKAITSALIMDRVQSAAKARGSSRGRLSHVTVLEEAHQLLGARETEGPRMAAVEALCNAIAELRAVGEGFLIADQRPSALARGAVANCGTRIMHKLVSNEDRESLLADAGAEQLLVETAARLRTGEALITWPDHDEIELIRVEAGEDVDTAEPATDSELRTRLRNVRKQNVALLPMTMCTTSVCTSGCVPERREIGVELADQLHDLDAASFESPASLNRARGWLHEHGADHETRYCAVVHGLTTFGPTDLVKENPKSVHAHIAHVANVPPETVPVT